MCNSYQRFQEISPGNFQDFPAVMASYYSASYCFAKLLRATDLVLTTNWSSEGKCQFFSFTHSSVCNRAEQGAQPCWALCVVLTESMQNLGERGWGFDRGLLFDLHPGMQRLPVRRVGMDTPCNPESRLDDKSFLLNYTCSVTAPLSVLWPWLYISTIPVSPILLLYLLHVSHLGLPLPPLGPESPRQPELQFRERAVKGKEERLMPRAAKWRQGTLQNVAMLLLQQ